MLRGGADEDDEEDSQKNRLIKRSGLADVIADFAKAASSLGKVTGLAAVIGG